MSEINSAKFLRRRSTHSIQKPTEISNGNKKNIQRERVHVRARASVCVCVRTGDDSAERKRAMVRSNRKKSLKMLCRIKDRKK